MRRVGAKMMILALVAGGFPLAAVAGDIARGKDIATNGKDGIAACSGCHGANGEGQAEAAIPRLAGLNGDYLGHQLIAFGNGTRDNAIMTPTAKAMDAATMADAAAYYASLPVPAPASVGTTPGDPRDKAKAAEVVLRGDRLASDGDWAANIPPCASCHGAKGLGVGASFPEIAGQSAAYITNALQAWKDGTRHDDPLGLMRTVATRLDEGQVTAISAYYASLPALPAGPREKVIKDSTNADAGRTP